MGGGGIKEERLEEKSSIITARKRRVAPLSIFTHPHFLLLILLWPLQVSSFPALHVFRSSLSSSYLSSTSSSNKHSPCTFNPLCVCSNGAAEFGSVICDGVPLADIPQELQEARVFKLSLRNNGLHRLSDAKLQGSGLWSLEVSHNQLSEIPSMAFYGLERALWELHLQHNRLTKIPEESISLLKKLTRLNLADNNISELLREDLKSLTNSLKTLDLSGNCLTSVPEGIFWDLQRLVSLDLSRNNIIQIHSMAFQNGVPLLAEIYLSGNLLGKIPFVSLNHIKSLRILDLSKNRIEEIQDEFFEGSLKLDELNLDYNYLGPLKAGSFENFESINYTRLQGNPIGSIEEDTFSNIKIKYLFLRDASLEELLPKAFKGLEKSLEVLDLSANSLKEIPDDIFEDHDYLRKLVLSENHLVSFSPNASGCRFNVVDLDLIGPDNGFTPLEEYGLVQTLRVLGMSRIGDEKSGDLKSETFEAFVPGLEILDLRSSGLKSISKDAFSHVTSVSFLDLSDNKINSISEEAFHGMGSSLQKLRISNALYFTSLPNSAFSEMSELKILDLSNNHIRNLPLDSFHKMSKLTHLLLQDNEISSFKRGTFHSQANPRLKVLNLNFNQIEHVPYDTFRFAELQHLLLSDNLIKKIDGKSFVEMTDLIDLNLAGNAIEGLEDETFQNLHSLENLDISYNHLKTLNFRAFDSLGTLSNLRIDVSHNALGEEGQELYDLRKNGSIAEVPWSEASSSSSLSSSSSNIASLDLSYNNFTALRPGYFYSLQNGLKVLNLSCNSLEYLDGISGLRQLRILDLSHNKICELDPRVFIASKRLQMLSLRSNGLKDIHSALFNNHLRLYMLDLSLNELDSLPATLFQRTSLEIFKVSQNHLTEIPVQALNPVQSTLKHLDLSSNRITTISDSQLSQIHLLVTLDLSRNLISIIDDKAFCCLPNLVYLNLGRNPIKTLNADLFHGVKNTLETLNIANASLTLLPKFQLHKLKHLNVSGNQLTFVPLNNLANLSQVNKLDLSYNELTSPPSSAWQYMHHLNELSLRGNPISKVLNDSFVGLTRLESLDISRIHPEEYQNGAFGSMPNLRVLKMTLSGEEKDLNLAQLLRTNLALSHLQFHFSSSSNGKDLLKNELQDTLSLRLSEISLEGDKIHQIHPTAFKFLRSKTLTLRVFGRESTTLNSDLFDNLGSVQNLTLDLTPPPGYKDIAAVTKNEISIGNPVSSYTPRNPSGVFLENLHLGQNSYVCSCKGIGWAEKWLRRWREQFCGPEESNFPDVCSKTLKDFREAKCSGSDSSVMEALRKKLECEEFNGGSVPSLSILSSVMVAFCATLFV